MIYDGDDMKNDLSYYELSNMSEEEIFSLYKTNQKGLTKDKVKERLNLYGENIPSENKKRGALYFIIDSFKDKFIIILIVLAIINYFTGDKVGSLIILVITVISALISFFQNYSTYKFNLKLKEKIRIFTDVIRDKKQLEVRQEKVVLGDIITLSAGSIVPADLYLIQSKDLFVNQASFTGESIAVEKIAGKQALINDEEIVLFGDGNVVRDYIDVSEVAEAFYLALESDFNKIDTTPVFNIGSGQGLSLNEIISIISEVLNKNPKINHQPARKFDVKYNVLDTSKAEQYLNYKHEKTEVENIKKYVKTLK